MYFFFFFFFTVEHTFCGTPTLSMALNVPAACTTDVPLRSVCNKWLHVIYVRWACNLKRSWHDSSCKVKNRFWKQILSSISVRISSLLKQTILKFQQLNTMEVLFLAHMMIPCKCSEAAFHGVILRPVSSQPEVPPSLGNLSSFLNPVSSWQVGGGESGEDPVGGFCGTAW